MKPSCNEAKPAIVEMVETMILIGRLVVPFIGTCDMTLLVSGEQYMVI